MEQTLPPAGLTPQAVDRETFQRVWRRVMPDQERSPIAPNSAEQTAKQGGRSAASPQGKKEYPRPIPAREPDRVPTKTAPSPVPAAPLPRNDRERLHHLIDLAQEGISMGQMLARRGGNGARNLSVLVSDRQRAMRQLSAACFLVTGQRYQPPWSGPL